MSKKIIALAPCHQLSDYALALLRPGQIETAFKVGERVKNLCLEKPEKTQVLCHIGAPGLKLPEAVTHAIGNEFIANARTITSYGSPTIAPVVQGDAVQYFRTLFPDQAISEKQAGIWNSAKSMINTWCSLTINPGDAIAVIVPAYSITKTDIEKYHGKAVIYNILELGPEVLAKQLKADAALGKIKGIVWQVGNPAGINVTDAVAKDVGETVNTHGLALLEEVMYNDISHTQCPSPAFHAGLNRNPLELVILVNGSMSKGLGRQAGLRYNPYVTSEAHMELLEGDLNVGGSHVHNLAAVALHRTAPHFAEFAKESPVYLDNAKAIGAVLNQHPDILVHDPEMGPFTFVNIGEICNKTGLTPDGVTEYLLEGLEHAIVSALTGKSFLLEGDHSATLRISACGFNDPDAAGKAGTVILAALSDTERMRAFAKAADPKFRLKDGEVIRIPNYYEGYMMSKAIV